MKTAIECIPCFARQALEAARLASDDESVHEQVLRRVLAMVSEMDLSITPPQMGQKIHRLVRQLSGQADPYRDIKDRFNAAALGWIDELRKKVDESESPLDAAARLAIAGNIIDFGPAGARSEEEVREIIDAALTVELCGDGENFAARMAEAENILYLADNTGEIVFDRLLIERLSPDKVTVAVKGSPVLNDATMDDARVAGLTDMVKVIDNGSDAPATVLEDCSEQFRDVFEAADVVIAKGQGNYESLSGVSKEIFFALKIKCPVIADDIGYPLGSMVLSHADGKFIHAAESESEQTLAGKE